VSEALRAALLAAADAVDAARAELGVLDGTAGDGDHGMSMSIGARNLRRRLEVLPPEASDAEIVRVAASAMGAVGGAIGPLYDAGLGAAAQSLEEHGDRAVLAQVRGAAEAAERAVIDLGRAAPGDKTLVDALHPLVESLRAADQDGLDLATAIASAIEAADSGAAGTAEMVARVGRASRLGERSRGLPDAGATSLAIVVRAMADAWRTDTSEPDRP
jgi:dihydroxyacetone kinase